MDGGWPAAVAHRLRQSHPIKFKDRIGGGVIIYAECSTCSKEEEFFFNKRLPPEAIAKKLQQRKWDTKRRRCPGCATSGRRTKRTFYEPPPPGNALSSEILRIFGGSRQEPLPVIELGEHMDVKIGINNKLLNVTIPRDSKFIKAFMNDSFKATSHWAIETFQDSPQDEPLIKMTRTKPPEGKKVAYGMVQGFYDSANEFFKIQMRRTVVSGIQTLGEFRPTEARLVRQDDNSFYFKLPKNRDAPQAPRPRKKTGVRAMKEAIKEAVKETVTHQPIPEPVIEPSLTPAPETKKITIRQAVETLNKLKDQHGDSMLVTVTPNGHIRVTIQYGPDE